MFGRRKKPIPAIIRTVIFPGLGEVTVSRSSRARRFYLTVRYDGQARVSVPYHTSDTDITAFVESRRDWIVATRDKLQRRFPRQIVSEPFSTRMHRLRIVDQPAGIGKVVIKNGVIEAHCQACSINQPHIQQLIKQGVEQAWRREAKYILPRRIGALASEHGFSYGRVSVRNTVSRWGSCSARNDISLSLHLMRLPDHLIDYVILHELCHTVHKNHGEQFHQLLDHVSSGNHRTYQAQLKDYSPRW